MSEKLPSVSIYGDAGPFDGFNPFSVLGDDARRVVASIGNRSTSVSDIVADSGLPVAKVEEIIRDLARITLIEENDDSIRLLAPYYTNSDIRSSWELGIRLGEILAREIEAHVGDIDERLERLSCWGFVKHEYLRFPVVGYHALDIGALRKFESHGILEMSLAKPGNRRYVVQLYEPNSHSGLRDHLNIAGSSSTYSSGFRFVSFGSGYPRNCFPDLLWPWVVDSLIPSDEATGREIAESIKAALSVSADGILKSAGKTLQFLSDNDGSVRDVDSEPPDSAMIELLVRTGYVARSQGDLMLRCPVFRAEDSVVIEEVKELVVDLALDVISRNKSIIDETIRSFGASANRIPGRQLFGRVWHDILGHANGCLFSSGCFEATHFVGGNPYTPWVEIAPAS